MIVRVFLKEDTADTKYFKSKKIREKYLKFHSFQKGKIKESGEEFYQKDIEYLGDFYDVVSHFSKIDVTFDKINQIFCVNI